MRSTLRAVQGKRLLPPFPWSQPNTRCQTACIACCVAYRAVTNWLSLVVEDKQPAVGMLEQQRVGLDVVQSVNGRVEAGHLGHHQVGLGRVDLDEAGSSREAPAGGAWEAPDRRRRRPRPRAPVFVGRGAPTVMPGSDAGNSTYSRNFFLAASSITAGLITCCLLRITVGQDQHARAGRQPSQRPPWATRTARSSGRRRSSPDTGHCRPRSRRSVAEHSRPPGR